VSVNTALAYGPNAERAYWDAAASGDGRSELFSVPGIEGWEPGVAACLGQIIPALTDALGPGSTVLDLGCGIGRLTFPLATRYPDTAFVGLDVSPKMVATARANAKAQRLRNARFLTGDGRTLPKTLPRLTGAFSVLTFQHVPPEAQEGYVRALSAKLDPGGTLCIQVVTTDVDHFLSHGVSPRTVAAWCDGAGLAPEAIDAGIVDESWAWLRARKP
jgi:SAM-dependent methyltransferase